ncbi:hypothetical protein [Nocardioides humi]|uniref:Uncharacterized protein n=1 Tax=Nocardioides humi TaxID=449461 RepID=A0ABN2B3N7_9ACTN|nr:hypothetical protein [Nocardioides humi]
MLPTEFGGFVAAVAKASPRGLTIVEEAIDTAIGELEEEIKNVKPDQFEQNAFIPKSAFGTAHRSPEVALHHTRAHAVMTATLEGVVADLEKFREACRLAHKDIQGVEDVITVDLQTKLAIAETLDDGVRRYGDTAYDRAVNDNAGTVATEENPATEEG